MRKPLTAILSLTSLVVAAAVATAADRWLHIKVVETGEKGETVRVNLPLSLAEKVLPAIQSEKLQAGKVKIKGTVEGVDLRALLEAVRTAEDNEYVTVESAKESVRVAKAGGYLLVKVREGANESEKVDIKIPFTVVEALLSAGQDELDLVAGIRALREHGDADLVTVTDKAETVRIWVDSKNVAE